MKTQHHTVSGLELFFHSVENFLGRLSLNVNRSTAREPEIRQVRDQGGRPWWYAYEPMTGEMTYLESETDVQRWREEHFQGQ